MVPTRYAKRVLAREVDSTEREQGCMAERQPNRERVEGRSHAWGLGMEG